MIYVVTGGTKGIGEQAVNILKEAGHSVINVDRDRGDICADLGTKSGREEVLKYLHSQYPDGIDGFISNAGIAGLKRFKPSEVLSINYFGAVSLMTGVFDLLKKRGGNCAVTVSGATAYAMPGKYYVDSLLLNCADEDRISEFVNQFDSETVGNTMYVCTKLALLRWVRRVAPSWAASGVNINAVAPGAVATTIMEGFKPHGGRVAATLPMPTLNKQDRIMDPRDIAEALTFLVSPGAKGCCGSILFCDAGTENILNGENCMALWGNGRFDLYS